LRSRSYKPFKIHISQTLQPADPERRLAYCFWLREQINREGIDFLNKIIWSDEAKFTNCGIFNRHNEHIWSIENPEVNRQVRPQVKFSINVWAGILGDRILGPFLFEGNLTAEQYLRFLNTEFQNFLMDIPLAHLPHLWFQQDGAPAHNSGIVRQFLEAEFPGRWIGTRGPVEWPARSPDLTPPDFFLWGTLKNIIYKTTVNTRDDLRIRILNAFASLSRRAIARSVVKIRQKINKCIAVQGNLFEHLRQN
jgi:hypothetical protein